MSPALTDRLTLRRVERWRKAIITSWQRQVGAVVATGRLLIRAHDDLINVYGAWSSMVRNDLPFSHATAQKLMAIARHPILAGYSHGNRLPASWTTLYQLSRFDSPTLEQLITSGEVNARTERSDVERMRRIVPPGTDLAIVVDSRQIVAALAAHRVAITKLFDRIYERIAAGIMTDGELQLVLTALDAFVEQMREFGLDVERRMRVEPMRTVNPPMWEDDE
jgi:hypothetical protein